MRPLPIAIGTAALLAAVAVPINGAHPVLQALHLEGRTETGEINLGIMGCRNFGPAYALDQRWAGEVPLSMYDSRGDTLIRGEGTVRWNVGSAHALYIDESGRSFTIEHLGIHQFVETPCSLPPGN